MTLGDESGSGILSAAQAVKAVVEQSERRECGEPMGDGSGRVCRKVCAPGRDYHGGGHIFALPSVTEDELRQGLVILFSGGRA